jgi:GrpB-like predicted nucleotidyltransferase (UPF0157 family)
MTPPKLGKPVVIEDYDPAWVERFERERDEIYRVCGREPFVRIEHVGSTSIPGLAAKRIIDMMPGLRSLDDVPPLIAPLENIGYEYVPEYEQPNQFDEGLPSRRYFRKDVAGQRAFHMHLYEVGAGGWNDMLHFRNYLRVFPLEAAAYGALKREIAASYNKTITPSSNANQGYTDRKTDFVMSVLKKARAIIAASEPIAVVEYDAAWPHRFEREREAIIHAAGDVAVDVHHVGSTSVPGLAAKPYVDIAIGVRTMQEGETAIDALRTVGYRRFGDDSGIDDWLVFDKREEGVEAYHLHMVPHDGARWRRYLAFRDHLRTHAEATSAYAQLKRELAAEFGRDRIGYTEAKTDFVRSIERAAGIK